MGVTGLWQIVHPCARPIKLETLNRKRLAVDASIWIYQFLKAVRDKEGNALRNSHVVGFFRRICKLLFFGIKPVFVFDGGAPALKRSTISERKKRREGRREDAVRTAGRLLAVQMQRRAEEDEQRRKDERNRTVEEEEVPDEGLVYADENLMSQQERQQNRHFKKKDAYHLPNLDTNLSEMVGGNDPRVMSLEELQAYAKQFETGEDINVYDFSKIDYDSPFFMSLPASDRYNILNAARLRSRLRMGYSKDQLDTMFPDRMAFSKFQVERVAERNNLTQRLMHINEGGDTLFNGGGRVAGEKGREYVLVKNDGVEGGWALGVISDEGTKQETAIDLDETIPAAVQEDEDGADEEDFEDVPIEGLNRLPKRRKLDDGEADAHSKQRQAFYKSRKSAIQKSKPAADADSLFVQETSAAVEDDDWEDVGGDADLFGEDAEREEDEELKRAIAMSLENDGASNARNTQESDGDDDDMFEVFNQSAVPEARPVPKGSGRAIANIVNKRAFDIAPDSHEVTSFGVPAPRSPEVASESEEDTMDFQAALAESRRSKRKVSLPRRRPAAARPDDAAREVAKKAGFSGPLPFEKLDLGTSLLGKKKMQERTEEAAGGFVNPAMENLEAQKKTGPLPPWFSGNVEDDVQKQRVLENEDRERAKEFDRQFQFQKRDEPALRRHETDEVIDLDAEDDEHGSKHEVIDLEAVDLEVDAKDRGPGKDGMIMFDPAIRMGDVAEKFRLEPPTQEHKNEPGSAPEKDMMPTLFEESESDGDAVAVEKPSEASDTSKIRNKSNANDSHVDALAHSTRTAAAKEEDEEEIDWSASEEEKEADFTVPQQPFAAMEANTTAPRSRSPSAEFEDVDMTTRPRSPSQEVDQDTTVESALAPSSGMAQQESVADEPDEFGDFSDPEDEELLRALTLEAEEHARFASTLNNKTQAQNIADYEKELKQLRNQQKKDRRDADEVTHIMIQECQQLLRLFGLPYITAPMEAEAQCAELVKLGLVDGIVTDDSDCFLFGGTRIYKNMFNQAKFVECYLTADLEKEFDLTREKMISVAHLLGSDYTEGLPGVGPVTALEIIGEFRTLNEFRDWLTGVQTNTITKSDDASNAFRKKFRRTATKLVLPHSFPDTRVNLAYQSPDVDSDPEQFQWGVPDLDALRSFLMATIGWSQERTDEVLVPVIRDMNRRADEGTQSNITAFFEGGVGIGAAGATKSSARGEGFAPRKRVAESSKRMGSALTRMAEKARLGRGDSVPEMTADEPTDGTSEVEHASQMKSSPIQDSDSVKKTRKAKKTSSSKQRSSGTSDDEGSDVYVPKQTSKARSAAKTKRGRKQG